MTLLECLSKLPDDLVMRDLAAIVPTQQTVAQLKEKYQHDTGDYALGEQDSSYGKVIKRTVRVAGQYGAVVFREV
jgi:hypothetical protein